MMRFRNEAAIGLEVSGDHQNLLCTLDYGELPGGSLYLAVGHIEGRTLDALMSAGGLRCRSDDIRMLGRGLLHALRFLHPSGVAHGDVVSGNVLVDTHGRARLANFSRATRFGSSPDGRNGDGRDGDVPARGVLEDLRALGRLLFELAADMPASYRGNPMAREHLTLHLPNDLALLIVFLLDHTEEFAEQQASIPIDGGCLPLTCSAPDTRAALPPEPDADVDDADADADATAVLGAFLERYATGRSSSSRWMPATLVVCVVTLMVAVYSAWRMSDTADTRTPATQPWRDVVMSPLPASDAPAPSSYSDAPAPSSYSDAPAPSSYSDAPAPSGRIDQTLPQLTSTITRQADSGDMSSRSAHPGDAGIVMTILNRVPSASHIRLDVEIHNGDPTMFRPLLFVVDNNHTSHPVYFIFRANNAPGCTDLGEIAPGARCHVKVWLDRTNAYVGRSLTLLAKGPERHVLIRGIIAQ